MPRRRTHTAIPLDFPVQPVIRADTATDPVTCGHCGLTWDDAIVTGWTPAPSARCPFEYFHVYPESQTRRTKVAAMKTETRD